MNKWKRTVDKLETSLQYFQEALEDLKNQEMSFNAKRNVSDECKVEIECLKYSDEPPNKKASRITLFHHDRWIGSVDYKGIHVIDEKYEIERGLANWFKIWEKED